MSKVWRKAKSSKSMTKTIADQTPYTFIDKDGKTFIGSKLEFSNKYNLRTKAVRHLVKGDVQTHKGWKLVKENIDDHGQSS